MAAFTTPGRMYRWHCSNVVYFAFCAEPCLCILLAYCWSFVVGFRNECFDHFTLRFCPSTDCCSNLYWCAWVSISARFRVPNPPHTFQAQGVINVADHSLLNRRYTRLAVCVRLRNNLYCVGLDIKLLTDSLLSYWSVVTLLTSVEHFI